jgi:hypothetical protein
MIFQYPSFLWALSALAIPIIIHLFNFRKTTRIYFSNIRFLKQVKQETTQKRKLKQFLVLASRLLFLFFLVMAFAQPFLPATDQLSNQQNVSIYLDNSMSMLAPVEEKTRALDAGVQAVQEILDIFPPDVKYQVITNDFAPFSNVLKSRSEVSDFLSQTRLSPISRSAEEITNRLLKNTNSVFWISDLQRSTFGSLPKIDTSLQLKLVPIKHQSFSNIFVDTVYLENPLRVGGDKNAIIVGLRNAGARSVEGLVTKLIINGVQASAATIDVEANSTRRLSFDIATTTNQINKAAISFSDYPVSFDNEFYFTLNHTNKIRIVEIKNTKEVTYVEQVYGNKELFSFSSFQASNFNYSLLNTADLLVINQLDKIEESMVAALTTLNSNTTILLIPGMKPDLVSYKQLLGLPVTLNAEEKLLLLEIPDYRNPFFQNVFEDKNSTMAMPGATKILDWGKDRSALLQLKDGRPFLSKINSIYVLACPMSKNVTDFFNHALFVPVMYRLAAMGNYGVQKAYYSLSSTILSIKADSLVGEERIQLIGKQTVIPMQRRLGNQVVLEVPRYLLEKGFYTVVHKKDTLDIVAFNLDKAESILENFSPEEAKAQFGGGNSITIFNSRNAADFRNEIKERYLGTPLWKYALVVALLFLLVEVLLLRFLK